MTTTIEDYAAAVASGEPTPGGGSVIATTASFAAALAEMVCHLTLARPLDPPVSEALAATLIAASRLRTRFLDAATNDELAYGAYRAAAHLPRTSPEERDARRDALEAALDGSAAVPMLVAEHSVELLAALKTVADLGTKHALADVQTSLRFAEAALKSALDMVTANTSLMKDRDKATRLDQTADDLLCRGEATIAEVGDILTNRFT